jgi:hypothetical protein
MPYGVEVCKGRKVEGKRERRGERRRWKENGYPVPLFGYFKIYVG